MNARIRCRWDLTHYQHFSFYCKDSRGSCTDCATILVTCLPAATAEDSRELIECFNWLMSTKPCERSCTLRGCYTEQCTKTFVGALLQSWCEVEPCSTLRKNTKNANNVHCGATCVTVELRDKLHRIFPI